MNSSPQFAALILLLIIGTACSTFREEPVIDRRAVNQVQFQRDLLECRSYADEVSSSAAILSGSAGGAIIGAAVGAAVGNSDAAQRGATVGAIVGAAKGGLRSRERKQRAVRRCLQGRGYKVLG